MLEIIFILSIISGGIITYLLYSPLLWTTNLIWQLPLWIVTSFVGIVVLLILFIQIYGILVNPQDKSSKSSHFARWFSIQFAKALLKFLRVEVISMNLELIPRNQKYLIISNHQSNLDALCMYAVVNDANLAMIMKDNLMKAPFISHWLLSAGFLPIDRTNDRAALKTIIMANKWVASGKAIGVYPEGTRSRTTEVLPFKNGIFRIAHKAKCPVVVCTIDGTYKGRLNYPFRRTKAYFKVSKVIEYEELKDLTTIELGNLTQDIIKHDLQELRNK